MSASSGLRVLVVDDSAYSRREIIRMLEASPRVAAVDWARDGEEALRAVLDRAPDLITLDLEMPRMDGFTFLRVLMQRQPTPVIVISGRAGGREVFKALDLGAIDAIAKPTAHASTELANIERELLRKLRMVPELRRERLWPRPRPVPPAPVSPAAGTPQVVAIGASTGGPSALMQILAGFDQAPQCAFLVAQHMPANFTRGLAERLARFSPLAAREARGGEAILPGTAWIAPGGAHLEVEACGGQPRTRVCKAGPGDRYAPSVDRLFESAAARFGADLLAIVLTGMGDDGRRGVEAVKAHGGRAIAESRESAVIFGMPEQAIASGCVDRVLTLAEISSAILSGALGNSG